MSQVDQEGKLSAVRRLKDELAKLQEQQFAAQDAGAVHGMTITESEDYKQRHSRMQKVLEQLGALQRRI